MYRPDPILPDTPMSAGYAAYRSIAIVFTSIVEYDVRSIKPLEKSQTNTFNVQSRTCRDPWQGIQPNHWLL